MNNAITHPVFGSLVWDERFEDWRGSCDVNGQPVEFHLLTDGERDIKPEFELMYKLLVPKLSQILSESARWVKSDLAHWLNKNEDKREQILLSQMKVTTVEIYSESSAKLYIDGPTTIYESGHCIEARIGPDAAIDCFCLAG